MNETLKLHKEELEREMAEPVQFHGKSEEEDRSVNPLEVGKPSGSNRIIKPNSQNQNTRKKEEIRLDELDNPNVSRLSAISGRTLSKLGLLTGGDIAWGHLILLNVDTNEQIEVYPEGVIPDGLWIPANHLPEVYLRSI